MLRKLFNKKAQNTAEYAILIALVVGGVVAMQVWGQRALQARVHDAGTFMVKETNGIGTTLQYEPYYKNEDYNSNRDSDETKSLDVNKVKLDSFSNEIRSGNTQSDYNASQDGQDK